MEIELNANPQLDYVYSVSLVKSGAIAAGVTRLQGLESATPQLFDVHMALAEAYSLQGNHQNAARELGIAVKLNPSDLDAQRKLASESAIH
jgi:predicted Zn-dependent protease